MAFSPRLACLLLASFAVFSCAKLKSPETKKVSHLVVPADEATLEEGEAIEKNLAEIERLASELGRPQSFHPLPVLVTTEDFKDSERLAACYSEEGRGRFILINRVVFENEHRLRKEAKMSTLFHVLLHEIGHCYFARAHSDKEIDLKKHKVRVKIPTDNSNLSELHEVPLLSLNSSAMHTKNMFMIMDLRKFYVAEIIGLVPTPGVDSLMVFSNLDIVERDPK